MLFQKNDEDKAAYLKRLFREVYFRDIEERYDIAMPDVLSELTDDLCSSIGSLTNTNKITNTLRSVKGIRASNVTISNYLEYLTEAFLFENAKRYDVKGKKYFEYPSKYYCTDIGLRNARSNFRQQEETHIMENIIYNELLRRGCSVDVGVVEVAEYSGKKKTKKQCEIDFVANTGSRRYYIQSALHMETAQKEAQEKAPLKQVKDSFKKIIIVKDIVNITRDETGITTMSIYDFLLKKNALEL